MTEARYSLPADYAERYGPWAVIAGGSEGIGESFARQLAAAGISGFKKMLDYCERAVPLQRSVTIDEVGNTAAFLCSDLASGITAETVHVDAGFHSVGISAALLED